MILIHCPALSHVYWRPIMDRLQKQARCIAIDLRGHGHSGPRDRPWTFAEVATDIGRLADHLGVERPFLVGYSNGACIALQAALDRPDRYGGLVVISGFSECTTFFLRAKISAGLAGARTGLSPLIGPNVIGTNSVGPSHTQAMLPDAKNVSPICLQSYLKEGLRFNITARLGEIRIPVLLTYGDKDQQMLHYCKILQAGLPDAKTLLFPGADHRVPTRQPDLFASALAGFLTW